MNMKMMLLKTGMLIGGAGVLGYMYMTKHPEMMLMAKEKLRDTSKMIYEKLDSTMIS